MAELIAIIFFVAVCAALMTGFPVAFTLGGVSLLVAFAGSWIGFFDPVFLHAMPSRLFGVMTNETLMAVPLFVFMGVVLERSRIAEALLDTMASLFGGLRGGLAFSVLAVGVLMAASTGIVGATVVTMGLLSLPSMLKARYSSSVATGTICAAGTLGQIVPPSIVLVILGDVMSNAYQQAQINSGVFSPETVSVGQLFVGALLPAALLIFGYLGYLIFTAVRSPESLPAPDTDTALRPDAKKVLTVLIPPILLILAVLGSIMAGYATPTEAAAVGAAGALLLALVKRELNLERLNGIMQSTVHVTAMVFMILIGASIFSLVFRGLGGEDIVHDVLHNLPGGTVGALLAVMALVFVLGFILDFIEITFVVVPIVGPVLLVMGMDPLWLGILIAINLQTSFLTPPFGFALFYLRGVAPPEVTTAQMYRGVLPFIVIQLVILIVVACFPPLVTWLPGVIYGP